MDHQKEKITQLRVGLFMALGLAALAATVVYFGRFGDGVRKYYELRVEYPNASGLLKGASVLLAGAKIGAVNSAPTILPDMDGVYVMLKIYDGVAIPSASEFTIGSSGLLGDRFVEIVLKKDAKSSPPISPGTTIKGRGESGGFGALADSAGDVVAEVKQAVRTINSVAEKIDSQVLDKNTLAELRSTITNLQQTSASFAAASGKLDQVVEQAKSTISTADGTLIATRSAAEEFRQAMADARKLMEEARAGKGPIGVLLSDREMAANLKALVENLRRYGVVWYKDREPKPR